MVVSNTSSILVSLVPFLWKGGLKEFIKMSFSAISDEFIKAFSMTSFNVFAGKQFYMI